MSLNRVNKHVKSINDIAYKVGRKTCLIIERFK